MLASIYIEVIASIFTGRGWQGM